MRFTVKSQPAPFAARGCMLCLARLLRADVAATAAATATAAAVCDSCSTMCALRIFYYLLSSAFYFII